MRRVWLAVLALLLVPASALAYPGATLTSTEKSVTVGNLDCGTNYEIRVREYRSGAWRDQLTYQKRTLACPTPTPTPTPTSTPTATPTATASATPPPSSSTACFPDPSSCGYPDADNTGPTGPLTDARFAQLPAGAAWDAQSEVLRITGNNVTVQDVDIPGEVTVDGDNFTLKNSRINVTAGCSNYPCGNYGIRLGQSDAHVTGTSLVDDAIVVPANFGLSNATGAVKVEHGVRNNGDLAVTATRVYIRGFSGSWKGPGTITDSYLFSQEVDPGDHIEPYLNGGEGNPSVLSHDTILVPPSTDGTNGSAAIAFYNDFGGIGRVDVINNLVGGGGFIMYGGAKNGTGNVTGAVTVRGNRITRAYFPQGGSFGLWSEFNAAVTTSCGNVWDEDSSPAPNPPGASC